MEDWLNYKKCWNQVTFAIRAAKASYSRNLIQDNLDNPRNFWRTIRKILPNTLEKSEMFNQIKAEGQTIADKSGISNAFYNYFSTVKSRISKKIEWQVSVKQLPSRYTKQVFHLLLLSTNFI